MSGRGTETIGRANGAAPVRPRDEHLLALGKLSYLAAYCPLHRTFPGHGLAALFFPAVNIGVVVKIMSNNNSPALIAQYTIVFTDGAAQ